MGVILMPVDEYRLPDGRTFLLDAKTASELGAELVVKGVRPANKSRKPANKSVKEVGNGGR